MKNYLANSNGQNDSGINQIKKRVFTPIKETDLSMKSLNSTS